jgi:hypothetical protein
VQPVVQNQCFQCRINRSILLWGIQTGS